MEQFFKRKRPTKSTNAITPATNPPPTPAEPVPSTPDTSELRLKRIDDLLQDALGERNPLRSNLRAKAADIAGIAYRLQRVIGLSLDETPHDLRQIEKLAPSIEVYLKLARQAERIAQIDCKLAEAQHGKTIGSLRRYE